MRFELLFAITCVFYYLPSFLVFDAIFSYKDRLTKFWEKKIFWNFLSDCYWRNISFAYSSYRFPVRPLSYRNASESFMVSQSCTLNQGCPKISFIPFKEPILWLGFLANRPLIRDFTSFVTAGVLGNLGSECRMAWKIYYFFGA